MNVTGIDIGTTTVCAVVVDSVSGKTLKTVTEPNDTSINSGYPFERIQQPDLILNKCVRMLDGIFKEFPDISAVGVTGQMHGILYCDDDGNAVSPLYTWQDESGNRPYDGEMSFADSLSRLTGYNMASGYGCTTYYYHLISKRVPENAAFFCTVHDYVVMKLTKRKRPLTHTSDAASLGLFDLKNLRFDKDAVKNAGLDISLFPDVTNGFIVAGEYRGVPVSVAIGDNQASFLGSVRDMKNGVLVNLGTGGQISYLTDELDVSTLEVRPCFLDKYISVGPSLCGGRAFAMLEGFLRSCAEFVTGEKIKSAYPAIDAYLKNEREMSDFPVVSTLFAGTRKEPSRRGKIENIGLYNLTPEGLITGFMEGIADELYDMYVSSPHGERTVMTGSGNGLRKNAALRRVFEKKFDMKMLVPENTEEASFGAALFAMTASHIKKSIFEAQELISYNERI
ncbi:MAG: hypothetical protein K6F09_06810 [Clostridiales bacterium]|nr:hypothetical protein [Clostridiales bacterium]